MGEFVGVCDALSQSSKERKREIVDELDGLDAHT